MVHHQIVEGSTTKILNVVGNQTALELVPVANYTGEAVFHKEAATISCAQYFRQLVFHGSWNANSPAFVSILLFYTYTSPSSAVYQQKGELYRPP
jgi:hypothetical protein